MLSLTTVAREQDFFALESEWDELFERAGSHLPFLRFAWSRLCWEQQRADQEVSLFILILRDGDRLVLIAPFVARRRLLVFKTISFLDSRTPQYNDILVENSPAADSYVAFLVEKLRTRLDLRAFRMNWVREDSLLWKNLRHAPFRAGRDFEAPTIDIGSYGTWEKYLASRSRSLRQDHGRQWRRLLDRNVLFHFVPQEESAECVAWLFDTKLKRMGLTRTSPAWIASPETERLFTKAAVQGIGPGHVWLTGLSFQRTPIAMCLAFSAGGTLYMSKITYDDAWENYSPGRTLFLLTIKEAFDRGLERCDLMVGEGDYKERMGSGHVRVFSRRVSLRGGRAPV